MRFSWDAYRLEPIAKAGELKLPKLIKICVRAPPGAFFRSSFSDVPGAPGHILATPGVLISGAKHSPPALCALVALRAEIPESKNICDMRSNNDSFF